MQTITYSDKETIAFGEDLSRRLHGGDIICLYGDLGTGKTTLVKGIARGFGIKKDITSPTFALMNVYQVGLQTSDFRLQKKLGNDRRRKTKIRNLIHIDTYRLKNEKELLEIGVEDYLGQPDTICVIEWPEKIEKLLEGKKVLKIYFEHESKGERKIVI